MKLTDKGQGALEYLLLIGGAVLIAAVVIAALSSQGGVGISVAEKRHHDALCAPLATQTKCDAETFSDGWSCQWVNNECVSKAP
jgi:uncharacterized protein (UPF0333 family)